MKLRRLLLCACAFAAGVSFIAPAIAQLAGTGVVRHGPSINGTVEGSLHQLLPEGSTLNGGAVITGDLLVPGTPAVRLNGNVGYGGTFDGSGAVAPSNYQITLNGGANLGRVVRRTSPVALPIVNAPPQPNGVRSVTITAANQAVGDFSTLRHLTLNGGVGQFAIPPGVYGDFVANGGSGFTLGVAGATQPAVYHFQHLTLNGLTQVLIIGPVIITVAYGVSGNGMVGMPANPAWLTFNLYSGGFTLNGGCTLNGFINAPNGTVLISGNSQLVGGVACDRLAVNGGGVLRLVNPNGTNRAPLANNVLVTMNEDATVAIVLAASDPDGDPLTFLRLSSPANGTITGVPPNLIYTPAPNFFGTDTFTFRASDGQADSNTATVQITVLPVNDRPAADSKSLVVAEDTPGSLVLTGTDVDGDPLTFTVTSPPGHGTLSPAGANLIYTPALNFFGADSFAYVATDGALTSTTATVSITITPINDNPIALAASYSVNEGQSVDLTLGGSDVDGNTLTFQLLAPPSNGTLTGTAPALTYRPNANFGGADSFTFRVFDGQAYSAPATVTLNVTDLNFAPVALNATAAIDEDTSTSITLRATDQDSQSLTYAVVTPPANGTLGTLLPGADGTATVVYSPNANFNGTDTFSFKARDSLLADSNVATVSIIVRPINDAPVAAAQSVQTDEDVPVTIVLTGSDIENTPLTYIVVTPPTQGTLGPITPAANNTASIVYTPPLNFSGADGFTFKVSDGDRESSSTTVAITIRPVNDRPIANALNATISEDTAMVLTLAGSDIEGSALTFSIITPPTQGILGTIVPTSSTTATMTYTPNANFNGADSFSFKASDGDRDSLPATASLTVTPQNDAPVATGQTLTQPQDTSFNFTLAATDADGDPLIYAIVTPPIRGTLTGTAPNLTYTPQLNDRGTVSLVFTASDGALTSNQVTVTFIMTPVNQAPVAAAVPSITIDEDTAATVALSATDIDGDALTFQIVSQPTHGSLGVIVPGANNTATVLYAPTANYHGSDSFSIKANDNPRDSNVVTVSLTIRPINDPPIASARSVTTAEDTATTIALTATDAEGDALTYAIVTPPANGTLSISGATVTYSPQPNFAGNDSFTWRARDGAADSNLATVSIIVTPVNDAPIAANQTLQTDEDVPLSVTLAATDVDTPSLTFAIVTPPARGTLTGTAPNLIYRPAANDSGTYAFTYRAGDGTTESAIASVAITVRPVNDAPVAHPLTISTGSGSPTAITLTGSDVDSPTLTFAIATSPQHGAITGTPPNVTYTSAANYGGLDSFTFTANDGALNSAPATIQISTGLPPRSRTYTTTADFAAGDLFRVATGVPDQLSNNTLLAAYDVVWIANSSKGTVIKLDPETGRAIGEFLVTPDATATPYPSRVAVDSKGNAWIANMSHSSIVKIGVPENGGWVDRNGNGQVDTSAALGDVRPWTGTDANSATDEAILLYVRTATAGVRQLTIDADDNVWVTGVGGPWQKFDGRTGALLRTEPSISRGENGGFFAPNGRIYSAGNDFLIWNPAAPIASVPEDDSIRSMTWASALDSQGNLWTTRDWSSTLIKYSPQGEMLGEYYHGEPWAMGIAIDANDHIWIAHSHCGHTVGHLLPDGTFLGNVEVANHGPVEVALDRRGRIWVVSSTGVVERINALAGPLGSDGVTPIGEVEVKSGNLGGSLWTYGRFTGNAMALATPDGTWTNIYDGTLAGTTWGPVVWNGLVCNDGRVEVEASLSVDGVSFGPTQFLTLANRTPSGTGRYLKTRVRLVSATTGESPVLHDLTVGTAGYTPPTSAPQWYVSAGDDINGNWPDVIQLKGAFCHSLHAFPNQPTYAWSQVSGPGTVTFSNPSLLRPTATFGAQGTYFLRVTATLGAETSTDMVKIVLTPYNRAPYPNAGYTTFRANVPPQIWLWGSVRDDGLPLGATVTSTWEKLFGPGTVTFNNPGAPATTASFSAPGVYVLQLRATDGELTGTDVTTVWLGFSCIPAAPDGLVAWWQAAGNGDDHIGGNQAFVERGADFTEGKIGGAFRFDGVNDRVRAFASPGLDVGKGTGFTADLWVRTSSDRTATLFEYGQNTARGFGIRQVGRAVEVNFREANGTSHTLTANEVLPTNTWTHIAASYDRASGEARLYINGTTRVVQGIGSFTLGTAYDVFMGGAASSTEFFHGLLDEISVYQRALYGDEIATFVNHPAGKRPPVSNLPPVVNAGPDLAGRSPNTAVALAGSVSDDGQPTNGTLFTQWSKISGPGSVTFANASAPATTATFSTGGIYVLKLAADDGNFCTDDLVEVRVGDLYRFDTDSSVAAWWTGNTTDRDAARQLKLERVNGIVYGTAIAGDGFVFDGVDDYGRAAANPALNVGSAGLTIELWVRPSQLRDTPLVQWTSAAGADGVSLREWTFGAGLYAFLRDTAGNDHTIGIDGIFTANTWVHVAVTYDRTTGLARLYRNGVLLKEQDLGIFTPQTSYPLLIGALPREGRWFQGTLDEITIYSRALTLGEIQAIHAAGAVGKVPLDNNRPPVISAGADVASLTANGAVTLNGVVTDDGLPIGNGISRSWSKVEGPGAVTFADPIAAGTTATFSAPGIYVLRLDGHDGLNQPSGDTVTVRVGVTDAAEPDGALAAWWPGNGEVGEVVRGNHDWEFLPRGPSFGPGKVAQGFTFNGADHYGRTAAHSDLNIGASSAGLTIELWVNPTQLHDTPLVQWTAGSNDGVSLRQWFLGAGLYAFLRDTAGNDHTIGVDGIFTANTWIHVAVTYDRTTGFARLYRNGVLLKEQDLGIFTPQTNLPMILGALPREGRFFQGTLDEVSLYTRPLSLAEIQAIHQAGVSGKSPIDDNLPPIVSAGPDVATLNAGAPTTLNGIVTDDGRPIGGALTVAWSKVEGPGTVTFADATVAATTATFSLPGTYVLRLDARDALQTAAPDTMVVRVGVTGSVEPDGSLAAWWPANGDVREVVRGNHDWEFLPRGPSFGAGEAGQGFTFNGSDHYGRTPAHSDLNIGASSAGLTIELWARPAELRDTPLVQWTTPAGADGVSLRQWFFGAGLYAFLRDTAGVDHTIGVDGVLATNTWVHVAVTYDRTTGFARLYRNGVLLKEQDLGIFTPQTIYPLVLGALPREGRYFQGTLDEICLYTRPLTLAEIQAIHQAGVNGKAPLDDNQPPVINAGPDIAVLNAAAGVPLQGSVADDGRPTGGTLTITWSKVEGPGTVTFSNPAAASTTATFSAPGVYVLRLDARDTLHTGVGDTMVVRIGVTGSVEPDGTLASWWPADGEVHEVVRGNHDWEFLPRGPSFGPGEVGQGFSFNGSDHYGRTAAHSDLNIGASPAGLTIELWARPVQLRDVPLVQWTTPTGTDGVSLRQWFFGAGLYAFLRDTGGNDHTIGFDGVFTANTWVHVAVTYDRATGLARLYRNGVLLKEQDLGIFTPQTSYPLLLGALPREARWFQGTLDEVCLYTRPLSLAEIQAIHQAGVNGKAPLDDNQPPVVSAGPDVAVQNLSTAVPLNGSVIDDGRPAGGTLALAWTKVEGPGTVTFADPTAPATTATFSVPGTYVLRLDARDALHAAAPDTMVVRIGLTNGIAPDGALAAWWPANGDAREVMHGGHDWEFLPRGPSFSPGEVGQGFAFNGADHYGRTAAHSDLNIGASAAGLTIELWVKPAELRDVPFVQWVSGNTDGVSLRQWFFGAGLYVFLRDTAGVDHTIGADGMLAANAWSHVAVTYDRGSGLARLYRNGVMVKEQNLGVFTPQTNLPLLLGALPREGRYFVGTLDEVCLYTRPLASGEIQAIHQAGVSGKNPPATNVSPVIALTSPVSGSAWIVNTPVTFTALASDTDGSVAKVEFFDGAMKLGEANSSLPADPRMFSFTFGGGFTSLGRHVITARVTDNAGATAVSGAVLLDVVPVLPVIALTSPAANSTVAAGAILILEATATYSLGSIQRVEFYDGGVKLGERTTPASGSTYSLPVAAGLTPGGHSLTAKVVAGDGAVALSAPVTMTATTSGPTIALTAPTNNSVLAANTTFTLTATASDGDGTVAKVEFFRSGQKLGEDLAAPYSFDVTGGLPVGGYAFTAVATDNTGLTTTSAALNVTFSSYSGPTIARIIAPSEDGRISQPTAVTAVVAHANLASWVIDYRLKVADTATPEPWITLASGNTPVGAPAAGGNPESPGALGTFDPTRLINGIYELQLRVTGTNGQTTFDPEPRTLVVEGNMKVGAFTFAFEDLRLPLAGIPITVTRTYDSRDLRVGDFGPGWRIALNNVRVQKSRHLGTAWYQTQSPLNPPPLFPFFVTPQRERIVTITLPDGETHRFRAGVDVRNLNRPGDPDNVSFSIPATRGKLKFYAIGDTTSKLEPLNTANLLDDTIYLHGTGEQDLMTGDTADPDADVYNTTRFRLTTKDGTIYLVDEALGLLEMRDLDGNALVLNRDAVKRVVGVTATQNTPSGPIVRSITITRDATGRVDFIRDPAGRDLDYLYDAQGRLSSFTNRELNVTQFRYELPSQPNYLTRIIDPRGVSALRSEYDAAGKLVKQVDADGRETIFNRGVDTTGRFEKVKDRLGAETTFYYDERGNVTLKIDPLGAQTTYSYYADSDRVKFETDHYGNVTSTAYDIQGNVIVHTTGARMTEDPANPSTGHVTRTSYNALSAPTQITDPDGRVQTFTYDPLTNNLRTHVIGVGGTAPATTGYSYKSDGTIDTITDPLGNTTRHDYNYAFSDPAFPGAVKQITVTITDPAGPAGSDPSNASATTLRVTRTLFDAQENQLAQIVSRMLPDGTPEDVVVRYRYDAENRLVATIQPDGRVSETRYTSFGKPDMSVLWRSVADYEAHNDANARITTYGYDTRGNQTTATYADGTTEAAQFDLENRRTWSQDRRGFRTFFMYDAVGRLRFTLHPDVNDGVGSGAPTSLSDSRLADNPRTETVYDLVGRVTDSYDELRRRTQSIYFPDGTPDAGRRRQTVAVRSVGNLVTSFQYDQAGNVRFVTDPRGNTTETRYDEHGRPRLVIFPATDEHPTTQAETKYDAIGRRIEVSDQEGKITRYRYDGLGRLNEVRQYLDQALAGGDSNFSLSSATAGVAVTRYAYDSLGNQQTQTDALGRVTTYWTDKLGRRTKRFLPKDATEPAFLTETLQYDEWGNLWKRTDFAARTTTFAYDVLNRLKSRAADPQHLSLGFSHAIARIEFDYDANGARTVARTFNAANTQLYSESTPRDVRGRIDYRDSAGGRLDYSYYANSRLKDVVSSNPNGVNIGYRYDEVNRLESVDDASTGTTRTTGYSYNANGALETVTQPNAVVHTYGYDALNRLRALIVAQGSTLIHTCEYKLRVSGHRRQAIEGTRTTTYDYDELYRLTAESIVGDTRGNNGDIAYDLDKVGNRIARNSQVVTVAAQANQSYNARDWLAGETYTANGSTQNSAQQSAISPQLAGTDTYDFEERLIVRTHSDGSTINISYDADGHRIAKNILSATGQPVSSTTWLVDANNLTGYAQVVEERSAQAGNPAATTTRTYIYGSDLIGQATFASGQSASVRYFAHDGHGSTRELTDPSGIVTDRYDYDAFGVLIHRSGTTPNAYLFCGEQRDEDLGLYYLRARYMNPESGRFWSGDAFEGFNGEPDSLHRYRYASSNPISGSDPSGYLTLTEVGTVSAIVGITAAIATPVLRGMGFKQTAVYTDAVSKIGLGISMMAAAVPMTAANPGIGYYMLARGGDWAATGLMQIITGSETATAGASFVSMAGIPHAELVLDLPIIAKALADVTTAVGPALKVKAVDAYYRLRNLFLKSEGAAQNTATGIPLKNNSVRQLLESRGLSSQTARSIVNSFDGQIYVRRGATGDFFVVTESAPGAASAVFVTHGSVGATPGIRIRNLALPPSNTAAVETFVRLAQPQWLIEGTVAPQLQWGPDRIGGAWQVITNGGRGAGAVH